MAKSKEKERKVVEVKCTKSQASEETNKTTGSKFKPNTNRQLALDFVVKQINQGATTIKELRTAIKGMRRENGHDANLNVGYLSIVLSSHPDNFNVYDDGTVEMIEEFHADLSNGDTKKTKEVKRRKSAKSKRIEMKKKASRRTASAGKVEKPSLD